MKIFSCFSFFAPKTHAPRQDMATAEFLLREQIIRDQPQKGHLYQLHASLALDVNIDTMSSMFNLITDALKKLPTWAQALLEPRIYACSGESRSQFTARMSFLDAIIAQAAKIELATRI